MKWTRVFETFYNFSFHKESYFVREAYLKSQSEKKPVDANGNPIPWMNYAILDFFSERLNADLSLFEYGSGFSTQYFASKLKTVKSIEYDQIWYQKVRKEIAHLENAEVKYYELDRNYANAILTEGEEILYQLILIDGRHRVACAKNACAQLTSDGVLILDDSDRKGYKEVFEYYKKQDFRHLTFSGIKPTSFRKHSTTIFYRPNNCLDI
ncbi:MAG: hypothetical protein ABJH98_13635 [Reichenbachiella sp.]|uniref:hypothetical protein n=1 Tax=Reichenbachiella sp. TaxID=2184521 RepID=UPI0032983305